MEPDGYLVLNEQRTEDGSAKILMPHPNFRLFLAMDPRHGELSRAMRNRSIEVYLHSSSQTVAQPSPRINYIQESFLYRLRQTRTPDFDSPPPDSCDTIVEIHLDHLSRSDLIHYSAPLENIVPGQQSIGIDGSSVATIQRYMALSEDMTQKFSIHDPTIYTTISSPNHPLVNEPLLFIYPEAHKPAISLSYLREFRLSVLKLQQRLTQARNRADHLKPSEMTRLERSLVQNRISNFRKDSTSPVGSFLSECSTELCHILQDLSHSSEVMPPSLRRSLRSLIWFLWDIFRLTNHKNLDEAGFQSYLQLGSSLFSGQNSDTIDLERLAAFSTLQLSKFKSAWALSSGLSMQRIWQMWRPLTCSNEKRLCQLIKLEQIEAAFRDISHRTRADLWELSKIRNSLSEAQRSVLIDDIDVQLLILASLT
jgi:midasin